jgi:hypothetical protein
VTGRGPDFDDLVGSDVSTFERERLSRVHDLLLEAGPPPELSPELETVPWPDDALAPLGLARRRRERRRSPLLAAAVVATVAAAAFLLGQTTGKNSGGGSFDTQHVVRLRGTALERNALATIQLGGRDRDGNWPMLVHVTGLRKLPEGGYYDLYLTRNGKPVALCGSFNVVGSEATVRLSAAYDLGHFDRDGWVVTRQVPPNHAPRDVVLRPGSSAS